MVVLGDYLFMDLVNRLLVLDLLLLRLLDGDREVGSRLLVELNCTFMDNFGYSNIHV